MRDVMAGLAKTPGFSDKTQPSGFFWVLLGFSGFFWVFLGFSGFLTLKLINPCIFDEKYVFYFIGKQLELPVRNADQIYSLQGVSYKLLLLISSFFLLKTKNFYLTHFYLKT